jgi:hypothetical protein
MKIPLNKPVQYARVQQGDTRYINQLLKQLDAKKDNHVIPVVFVAPNNPLPFQVKLSRLELKHALLEAKSQQGKPLPKGLLRKIHWPAWITSAAVDWRAWPAGRFKPACWQTLQPALAALWQKTRTK